MRLRLLTAYVLAMALPAVGGSLQEHSDSTTFGTGAVLVDLQEPLYPRLAQIAAVQGDVELTVHVKKNGAIESVDLVSGSPMLLEAAIASARASKFECQTCDDSSRSYSLVYEFRIVASDPEQYCKTAESEEHFPSRLNSSRNKVTVLAREVWTCDPSAVIEAVRVRSAKCLYIWKCGLRPLDRHVN